MSGAKCTRLKIWLMRAWLTCPRRAKVGVLGFPVAARHRIGQGLRHRAGAKARLNPFERFRYSTTTSPRRILNFNTLDTHHGLFARGMLEVATHPAHLSLLLGGP